MKKESKNHDHPLPFITSSIRSEVCAHSSVFLGEEAAVLLWNSAVLITLTFHVIPDSTMNPMTLWVPCCM